MPPALPGFYYDAEKRKYFKIQPNHVAANASAGKYSKAAVKKEAEEQRGLKRRNLFAQRVSEMRVKRSRVLESPLAGGWCLARELGVRKLESSAMVGAWAQGLERNEVLISPRPDAGAGTFVFDTVAEVLTYAEALRGDGADASFSVFV